MSGWEAMSGIARAILTMSVSGSVIALLLFAIKPLIKNRLPQNAQYYLWSLVLVALLIPFSTFVAIPLGTPMTPVQSFIQANIKSTAEWQEEIALKRYNKQYEELAAPEQVEIGYKEIGLLNGRFNNHILFSMITLGGIVFLIEIIEYFVFAIKLRCRRLAAKDNEMALLRQLCQNSRLPRLYRNPIAPTPMLMGIFCPVIYLPDMDYSEVQLCNVLLHELTHLRRHDVVIKWLAALAVNLHWFNPIVYYVRREIDRACELACDEAVINNLNTDQKQKYGDTLLAVVAKRKLPKIVMSTTMCEEKKALKERLGAIMTSKGHTRKTMAVSGILLAVVLCTTVVFGASVLQENAAAFSDFKPYDTFDFSNLAPKQSETYTETLTFSSDSTALNYIITWTSSGLAVEIGLVAQDGTEYMAQEVGGSAKGTIKEIPAGTYQLVLRSSADNQKDRVVDGSRTVTGAVAFNF